LRFFSGLDQISSMQILYHKSDDLFYRLPLSVHCRTTNNTNRA